LWIYNISFSLSLSSSSCVELYMQFIVMLYSFYFDLPHYQYLLSLVNFRCNSCYLILLCPLSDITVAQFVYCLFIPLFVLLFLFTALQVIHSYLINSCIRLTDKDYFLLVRSILRYVNIFILHNYTVLSHYWIPQVGVILKY